MRFTLATLIATTLMATQVLAQATPTPQRTPGNQIHALNCMVQYKNKVNVPAKAEGTLVELRFEEGDTINKDDVIAVIDDTAAALALKLKQAEEKEAILNAANEVNLKDAINSEKLATAEAKAYEELRRQGAIPFWEMEKKRLEAERARLRIDLAEMQKKIAEVQMIAKRSEREIADYELTRRKVTAPLTGFIETRIAQLGEWVQPGSPIATVIQMDRLRVEGDVDGLHSIRVVRGMPVQIEIHSGPDKSLQISGKLDYVSMEMDLNHRYRVWVEVENKKIGNDWVIKPGMQADIVIKPAAQVF